VWPFFERPQVPVLNIAKAWEYGIPPTHPSKNCVHASFKFSASGILGSALVQYYNGIYLLHLMSMPGTSGTVAVTMTLQYGIGSSTASVSQTFNVTVGAAQPPISIMPISNVITTSGTSFSKTFSTNLSLSKENFAISYTNPALMNEPQANGGFINGKFHKVSATMKKGVHGFGVVGVVAFDGYSFAYQPFQVQVLGLSEFQAAAETENVSMSAAAESVEESPALSNDGGRGSRAELEVLSKETIAMKTYPNPASHKATVEYALPSEDEARVELFTAQGVKIQTVSEGRLSAGDHRAEVDVSGLQSGSYILRVYSAKYGVISRTITVVR
jgi:hypothetical protein